MRRWISVSLLGAIFTSLPMTGVAASRLDCSELKNRQSPDSATLWFARSIAAGRCYDFSALAMRVGPGGIRTLEIEHRVNDQGEQESTRFLDGPRSQTRNDSHLVRHWQFDSKALGNGNDTQEAIRTLKQHYRFETVGPGRVADRDAVIIDILPRDSLRFGHRLWLDRHSGLLLKQQLFDSHEQPLEIVQLVSLKDISLYHGWLELPAHKPVPASNWHPQWLPAGFYPQPVESDVTIDGTVVHRQLYSDGLSTLSVFLGPANQATSLREGVHRLGNFRAASRHFQHQQQTWQLVAVGEVPPEVLTRTVADLDWQPSSASVPSKASSP